MGSWDADTNSPVLGSGGGEAAAGTTTSTTANKLVDSSASFTSTVTVGDQVVNQVDGQTALVSNVDSDTTLSLDNDIMLTGEAYTIDNSPFITQGHYYVVSVGGATSLNGVSNWTVGDWVIAGANNQWTKLDHSQVDGTGTTGNLTKWSSTSVIADSIVSESGSAITVDGSLSTNTNLSSTGDFAVNTDKFTVASASGNTAFAGDLAINTDKFTVDATNGNTLIAGDLDVDGTNSNFAGEIDANGEIRSYYNGANYARLLSGTDGGSVSGFNSSGGSFIIRDHSYSQIVSDGNFGIGIGGASAIQKVHIQGTGTTYMHIGNDTTGSLATDGADIGFFTGQSDLQILNRESASVIISTNDTPALTLDSSQNATFAGNILFATDGTYDIGSTSGSRPRNVVVSNSIAINTSTGAAGTLNVASTGTFGGNVKSNTGLFCTTLTNAEPFMALQRNSGSNGVGVVRLLDGGDLIFDTGATGAGQTTRLTISGSGNSTFAGQVSVAFSNPDVSGIQLQATTGTNAAAIMITNTGGNFYIGKDKSDGSRISGTAYANAIWAENANPLVFGVSNSEKMRIADTLITFPTVTELRGDIGSNKFAIGNMGDASSQMMVSSRGFITFNVSNTGSAKDATERMRIDSSGNVGIGVTPYSHYTGYNSLDIGNSTALISNSTGTNVTNLLQNAYLNSAGTAWVYKYTDEANQFYMANGQFNFENAPSGTAGTAITWTRRLTIQADGNVGIGESDPDNKFVVRGSGSSFNQTLHPSVASIVSNEMTDNGYHSILQLVAVRQSLTTGKHSNGYLGFSTIDDSNNQGIKDAARIAVVNENGAARNSATALSFWTNVGGATDPGAPTERMRLTSGGLLFVGDTTTNYGYAAHHIENDASQGYALILRNSNTATTNNSVIQLNQATSGSDGYFMICRQGDPNSGTNRLFIFSNGNVQNFSNSYGGISDERLKENIVDATPKLDDLMKVKIRNYNFIGQEDKQIGVIAQEIENVFPNLVEDTKDPESEETTKSVKYSVLVPIMLKAIQELKAEVDSLKQKCNCKN